MKIVTHIELVKGNVRERLEKAETSTELTVVVFFVCFTLLPNIRQEA